MPTDRPDPDALLAALRAEESAPTSGRLKIFLGMCPGVGKTYAMLLAGQTRHEEGVDVVIGIVETHGRVETTAVSTGLPRIPRRTVSHRGVTLEEMDLEAILARRPQLAIVDELAHSNAAGSRHPKRWQDVTELLQAGIDVYTTLNIQHIESYRDVVRQITGAPINETVPDSVLDLAHEIELIDLTPDQLRKRLEEGKVYLGERAATAAGNFFREGNLKALREIALRITAEKADRELRDFMQSRRITGPWRSRERLLVAVGPSPYSEGLIRLTRRIAIANHATWLAVHVDGGHPLDQAGRLRLESNLSLARSLGAEVSTTSGQNVADTLLRVARENNVSQIIVGKPLSHPWVDFFIGGSLVHRLIRDSGDVDIYVVRVDKAATPWRPDFSQFRRPAFFRELGFGALIVTAMTIVGLLIQGSIGYSAVGLLFLLAVVLCATRLSRIPILCMAALTALVWDYLFIPPRFDLYISGAHDLILFGTYFVVALVIGQLHSRLRQREHAERRREQQATALYQFSRSLSVPGDFGTTLSSTLQRMHEIFGADFTVLIVEQEKLQAISGPPLEDRELGVASWTLSHNEAAGCRTNTLPESAGLHLPLRAPNRTVGVLSCFAPRSALIALEERQMLETFASQLALFIEQHRIQDEAERARLEERSRQLQKTLLDSVSHEFKTPLAIISTATERLQAEATEPQPLLGELRTASARLERVVNNLLSMTRIETGSIRPVEEWYDLQDIADEAFARIFPESPAASLVCDIPAKLSTIRVDAGLLEEILVNLFRNAAQHSPPGSPITFRARPATDGLTLSVFDEGPGLPPDLAERVFEKFQRGPSAPAGGLGLGLSIVQGLTHALGGSVNVTSRSDRPFGTEFRLHLPIATLPADALDTHP